MDMSQLLRALGLQQAYQSYQQNIGQPFANVAGPFGRGLLGLDRPEYGEEQAYRTGQAVGNMPAVSAPVGAFKAAAQVPGLLVDATQMAKQIGPELAGLLGLTAFHGSPHRFSKFDASKIGTGEGAQVYGHGLYFAESPDVANTYKSALSQKKNIAVFRGQDGYYVREGLGDSGVNLAGPFKTGSEAEQVRKNLPQNQGAFYTVDIPDEMVGKMLDWDKPLEKQNDAIYNAFRKAYQDKYITADPNSPAGTLMLQLQQSLGAKGATDYLRKAGIPGIRYLDQGSRGTGTGTRNFVVFPGEEEALKMLSVE